MKKLETVKLNTVSSTSTYARENISSLSLPSLITADYQTNGRGRQGKSFYSPADSGLYMTLAFEVQKPLPLITPAAAVAVCETLRYFGLSPVIKWANDVFVDDKKICGILIENTFSGAFVQSSVVGVGLNVNGFFEGELKEIATSMQAQTGKTFSVEKVTERLIDELLKEREMQEYLAYIGYMGREVTLILGEEKARGKLLSVDGEGGLLAEINGETRRLTSAEVSIRL